MAHDYQIEDIILENIVQCDVEHNDMVKNIITANENYFEKKINFHISSWDVPSKDFMKLVASPIKVNYQFKDYISKHLPKPELTIEQKKEQFLNTVKNVCQDYHVKMEGIIETNKMSKGYYAFFSGEIFDE